MKFGDHNCRLLCLLKIYITNNSNEDTLCRHFGKLLTKMKPIFWIIVNIFLTLNNNFQYTACFLFYSMDWPDDRPPNYSYSDSWDSEELWSKEDSLIHVQLVRPSPKQMPIWELRDKDRYLMDSSLDFDSPFYSVHLNNCLIEYKSVDSDELIIAQISGSECSTLPLNSLHYINNLTHLIIRDTALVKLSKFIFGNSKLDRLKRLDIIDNKLLTQIHKRAFDGLSQLAYLSLINNLQLYNISDESFVGLKNLEELIWVSNGLSQQIMVTLSRASSVGILPTLIHLHISGFNQTIYDNNDSHLLSRDHNNLSSSNSGLKLNKDLFIFLTHVKYLQITNCDIKFIHPLAFTSLTNLKRLNLSGNRKLNETNLKQAITNAFHASVIEKLDLSAVLATTVMPKDLLSSISKLQIFELYLNYMKVEKILFGDIPPMPYLKALFLEYSQLKYIEENSFQTLEELVKLSLRGNFLNTIAYDFISDLPKLEYLDLSGYKYNRTQFEIPSKTFIGTNLKEVNLSYKLLDPLPRNAFLGLFKMQRFHLRGCGLKFVEYLTFFPLKSAVYIDLSENDELIKTLRDTHEDSLFGLEAIQMLRMADCKLTRRDITNEDSIFKRIHEHVLFIDLSHNHIDSIADNTFANFSELQHIDLSYNSITSWSNGSLFSSNKFITTLDISNNKLSRITSSMIEDFHRLKNLSFAMNPIACDCKSPIVSDWLSQTLDIHYLNKRHPLHSKTQYYCISKNERIAFKQFIMNCKDSRYDTTRVSLRLLSAIASTVLLLTLIVLIIAFVYYSTLRALFNGIEDDVQHDYQYDAFVSYNVNDSDWVFQQLVPNIENNDSETQRIKLCVYDRDFIAGRPISECILESIKTSRKVILVISNHFVDSPWCRFETDLAHNTLVDQNRDGLIMIKLEEIDSDRVPPQLYYLLKTRIYLQWIQTNTKEQEIFWKKLRQALGFATTKRQYRYYYDKLRKPSIVLTSVTNNNDDNTVDVNDNIKHKMTDITDINNGFKRMKIAIRSEAT